MVYAERTHWTAVDLVALPEDGYHYDLVKGRLVVSFDTSKAVPFAPDLAAEVA